MRTHALTLVTLACGLGSASAAAATIPAATVDVGGLSVTAGPTSFTSTADKKTLTTVNDVSASATAAGTGVSMGISTSFAIEFATPNCEPGDVTFTGTFSITCTGSVLGVTTDCVTGLPSDVAITKTIPAGDLGSKLTVKLSDMAGTYGTILTTLGADVDFNIYLDKIYAESATGALQIHAYAKPTSPVSVDLFDQTFWVANEIVSSGVTSTQIVDCAGTGDTSSKKCFLVGEGTGACVKKSEPKKDTKDSASSTTTIAAIAAVAPLMALAGTM